MRPGWAWLGLVAGLAAVALLLAWADSTVFQALFPQPLQGGLRRTEFRLLQPPPGRAAFAGLGPVGGLFSFWWFVDVGGGAILAAMAVLVLVPARARRAAERVRPSGLTPVVAAGVASLLLTLAVTLLLRSSFVMVSLLPLLWGLVVIGVVFGVAGVALALGWWLEGRLGPAPPLLAALAGLLVLVDVALVPVAGWVALSAVAVTALGLAVLTRMGSPSGWSLEELKR